MFEYTVKRFGFMLILQDYEKKFVQVNVTKHIFGTV